MLVFKLNLFFHKINLYQRLFKLKQWMKLMFVKLMIINLLWLEELIRIDVLFFREMGIKSSVKNIFWIGICISIKLISIWSIFILWEEKIIQECVKKQPYINLLLMIFDQFLICLKLLLVLECAHKKNIFYIHSAVLKL